MKLLVLFSLLALFSSNVKGAPLDEDFGYVDVREGAHMFWVVYHTELTDDWTQAPLIMWLQGGPGASGVGFGNFVELGPYDMNGNLRPGRWTLKANLMFVDNPVGTGYSYVDDPQYYTTNNTQIADDLVTMLISVFNQYPEMQGMPYFVYAESYGGKMTADFAIALDKAIANGDITCNFQGIALGDSWISPMDSVNTWGPYLYGMAFVNRDGLANINAAAARTQNAVDEGRWTQATIEWGNTEGVVLDETDGVDFYNVLVEDSSIYAFDANLADQRKYSYMPQAVRNLYFHHVRSRAGDEMSDFMNGPQAEHWNIPDNVVWDSQGGEVFTHLYGDFMKPVIDSVSYLLANSNIHVAVYTGDLDLICDTPGTYKWIENMDYPQKTDFESTPRKAVTLSIFPNNAYYYQRYTRFSVFSILRSGHMVPIDQPDVCLDMIDRITAFGAEAVGPQTKTQKVVNKVDAVHSKLEKVKKDNEQKVANQKEEVKEKVEDKKEEQKKVVEEKKEEVKEAINTKVEEAHEKETEKKVEEVKDKVSQLVQQKKENKVEAPAIKDEVKEAAQQKVNEHQNTDQKTPDKAEIEKELKVMLNHPVFKNMKHNPHPHKIHH